VIYELSKKENSSKFPKEFSKIKTQAGQLEKRESRGKVPGNCTRASPSKAARVLLLPLRFAINFCKQIERETKKKLHRISETEKKQNRLPNRFGWQQKNVSRIFFVSLLQASTEKK
jgi:hypothetical protein